MAWLSAFLGALWLPGPHAEATSTLASVRAPGRSIAVGLVPAGTIAGHVLGYLLAGQDPALAGAHSHLRPVAWVAAAVAATALVVLALVAPDRHRRRVRLSGLVPAQVALFGLMEVAEHLHDGAGSLACLHHPSFRWGVAAQIVSAGLMVAVARLARASGARVRALLSRRSDRPVAGRPSRRWARRTMVAGCLSLGSAVSERGPPPGPAPA